MAVSLDAKGQIGGGVTIYRDGVQLPTNNVSLIGEGVSLTPVSAALLGNSGPTLSLSNSLITAGSSVGTKIGNFSVTGGSTRTYTFTLVSNPGGLFSVAGSTLSVAAALSPGSDPISAKADDGNGSTVTSPFLITVISTAAPTVPSLQFNNSANSTYIPLMAGIG